MTQNKKTLVISLISYSMILVFALLPLISVFVSSVIADHYGCALNEGGTYPCVVGGTDVGETLNFMFVAGWFMFLTLPLGAVLGATYTVGLVIFLIVRSRNKPTVSPE